MMKNFKIAMLLLFFCTIGFAQYMPVYDADTTVFEIGVEVPGATVSAEIYVSGDTIINDQSYKKVWVDSEYDDEAIALVGFTREDASEGKIWFRRVSDTYEILVMDLSLEVGDTFILNEPGHYCEGVQNLIVNSIDTIDGRKNIIFDCFNTGVLVYDTLQFIEGVGPNTTIFFQTFDLTQLGSLFYFNYGYTLCRMLKNDTIFYPEGGTLLCDFFSPVSDFDNSENIIVFPNPSTGVINIESIESIRSMYLYNLSGVQLLYQTKDFNQINIYTFLKGIYYLKIVLNSGEIIVKKVIKQ